MIISGRKPVDSDIAISRQEAMAEFMYLGLRMTDGISRKDFYETFEMDIDGRYGAVLRELTDRGMINASDGRIKLTEQGRDISNQILCEFL